MYKINNIRAKKVGSNLDQFKTDQNQDPDTRTVFPEESRNANRRRTDFRRVWNYLELLFSMLADSFNKKYPVPKKTVLVLAVALLYIISPVDFLPDVIPLLGFADDIAVLAFASGLIKEDLENYRTWKISNL